MKKNLILSFGVILFTQYVLAQTAVPPAAGDGSKENPYQIATLENLYWFSADSVNWKYNYIQIADINAAETSTWFGGKGWVPIYKFSDSNGFTNWFTGSYNGHGHIIDSLFINRPNEKIVGLFGYSVGIISNLGMINVNIIGGSKVGSIVGWGSVKNCFSTGFIQSTMDNTGLDGAGGLVGTGSVENCYSNAAVNSFNYGGGLVGNSGPVLNSYANGKVSGRIAGGLAGISSYFIMNSYSRATVNGSYKSGGLAGVNNSLILNCYAAGKVNGADLVGGLTGDSTFTFVYNSYWDIDSTGQTTSLGGKGKTTAELKNPLLFTNSPWDSSIWSMDDTINDGYPYLSWQNLNGNHLPAQHIVVPAAGDGSSSNPYQIATLDNLYWLTSNPMLWWNYFIQTADINASETRNYGDGEGWVPIGHGGDFAFFGNYNGNGHIIDSLYINRPEDNNQGFFGQTKGPCVIDSLGLTNENITGSSSVGGVSGSGIGYIGNCFSTGKIYSVESNAGGLVGMINAGNTISKCYSKAKVQGKSNVGGLVGSCSRGSKIEYSYSVGAVGGISDVGGLVGILVGPSSSVIFFSFWDTVSSGQSKSAGGSGKSTLEMKSIGIFSDVGWNPAVWFMDSTINDGYPYLAWQNSGGTPIPLIAKFVASQKSINFGSVQMDSSESNYFSFSNPGFDTLYITSIFSTNTKFTIAQDTIKLAPSKNVLCWVTFTPKDTSTQTGYLILVSNALSSPDTLLLSGQGEIITSVKDNPNLPTSYSISQNYPNPFNPATRIDYAIPRTTFVSLKVYDILGREVSQLVNEVKQPGKYSIQFDGANLSSGMYLYSITAGELHQVRKMVLTR